ncbi:MAG TPA: hypothetical protein VGM78_06110, partial [Ilumatobacteraceae bacterium]
MPSPPRPIVAITMGDPAGVGPEVVVKALARADVAAMCAAVVIGDAGRLARAAALCGVDVPLDVVDLALVPDDLPFGAVSPVAGEAAYRY